MSDATYLLECFRNQQCQEPADIHQLKKEAGLLDPPEDQMDRSPSWAEIAPSDSGIEGARAITTEEASRIQMLQRDEYIGEV